MRVDWTRADFVNRRLPAWMGWAVLGVAGAASAGVAWEIERRSEVLAALELRLTHQVALRTVSDAPMADRAVVETDLALRRGLGIQWQPVFSAIEAPGPVGVVLLAVEPDAAAGTVRLAIQAPDLAVGAAYLTYLNAAGLQQARLVSHQALDPSTPGGPVRLAVQAKWSPYGP
ncbi:hypothetical protein OOT46_07465 [Aquabacterium sp. A7-Y]|uniref:hypothetical protein n=1 Tax=Aquabacterium sp. A7-Y TaxID=1349605 RepID=UPI00223DAFED|nr:hypothetical protein [Aquabacterium sp. A7-Y]MCW7537687.1 hypothetical protein [Aquabacterium sp. A7-Y]